VTDFPQAVLFDMDGTLLDSEPLWDDALRDVAIELGGELRPEVRAQMVGTNEEATAAILLTSLDLPLTMVAAVRDDIRIRMRDRFNRPVDWRPGARELVTEVRAAGLPTALVTSTPRELAAPLLKQLGPENFDITIFGDEVANKKPHPEPYLIAAERLGIDIRASVAIEDSPNGALGAARDITTVYHAVRDFTLAEIKTLDAGSWFSEKYAGEPVPTLKEMVEQVRPTKSGILMELKSPALYPGIEKKVAAEFDSFPGYVRAAVAAGRLVVQSFDFDSMKTYKRIQPQMPVGLLGTPAYPDLDSYTWADQINPHYGSFDAGYVARVHALGMDIHSWTVNDAATMSAVLDRGVDGIITNHPDVLREVIAERRTSDLGTSDAA
jgi:HAD superfamily hydrolase (TIGR01509 family)